jgi:hypothetical protein
VDIHIEPKDNWFGPGLPYFPELKRQVLESRPTDAITWSVPLSSTTQESLWRDRYLRELNQTHGALILEIRDSPSAYLLTDGSLSAPFDDFDSTRIVREAVDWARTKGASSVYLMSHGFSPHRQEALDREIAVHGDHAAPSVRVISLKDASPVTEAVHFEAGWRIETPFGPPERIVEEPHIGYWRRTATFFKQIGSEIWRVTVSVVGRNVVTINRFLETFGIYHNLTDDLAYSLVGLEDIIRIDMKKADPSLTDHDVFFQIEMQVKETHVAELGMRRLEGGT